MKENQINPAYPDTMKTIAIDFDGVVHDDSGGYNDGKVEGDVIPGVKDALKKLKDLGYKLILFSCKARKDRPLVDGKTGKQLIREWLKRNNLDYFFDDITSEKPACCLFIDDNAYRFDGWLNTIAFIENNFEGNRFKVPKKFELLHKTITIIHDKKIVEDSDAVGLADYRRNELILHQNGDNVERPKEDMYCTFFHECFHHVFHALGEKELRDNEKLVDNLASAFTQIFKSSEF